MARSALFSRLQGLFLRARPPRAAGREGADRREVLAALASALAVPGTAAIGAGCRGVGEGRVAIVGAGIAGLHVAWRLGQAGAPFSLYESSDRVGGRMWTGTGLFANGHVCELGGELIDTNHATLWELSAELGLTLDDRQAGPYAALTVDTYWIDGAKVSDETLLTQLEQVIDDFVADFEAAESDDDAYTALDTESLADWLDRRVPESSFPDLHRVLDVAYRGEFGLENDQQSALNLIYLIGLESDAFRIFGESDERYHTHTGNQAFPDALAADLPAGAVKLEHRLVKAAGKGPYTLTFETPEGNEEVEVDVVVFALPFSTLRRVDLAELDLSDGKREIIADLGFGTNAKVMAGFDRPVWREDHQASGGVSTDLPFQQSWDTSLGQDGPGAILTNFLGGEQGVASGEGTPEAWVDDVLLPGIDEVFPGTAAAYTGEAVRLHWPTMPHMLGSYTCYKPGQWEWWSTEGESEKNLHFCGEHTSADFQGWMEGGAESGARVAIELLRDLGKPLPDGLGRLDALRSALPPIPKEGRNAIRSLRARRVVLRAWAELNGRVRR